MALKRFNLSYDMLSLKHSKAPGFQYPPTPINHYNNQLPCSSVSPPIMTLQVRCSVSVETSNLTAARRWANYQPATWNYNHLQSLQTDDQVVETNKHRATELVGEVRSLINNAKTDFPTILELIDDIQRLGLGYRFEDDIRKALGRFVSMGALDALTKDNLRATSLGFRILRQHGYQKGNFKGFLKEDVKGMLSLYEASFLAFEGEQFLDEAKKFTALHLNTLRENTGKNWQPLAEEVNHALELPLHRRTPRLEARWRIETYQEREDANQELLELAVVDFNMVQSVYQTELRDMWWMHMGLANKLSFARDRLTECFYWAVGMIFEPQYSYCRKGLAKVASFITILDDVYDVYGTLDELVLFTNAVERWDVNAINELPDYMKLCFLALYNTTNEMAYDILKQNGENILPYLTKAWADLCKSFVQEAKWLYTNSTPTFEDYLENARISSSGPLLLELERLEEYHALLRWPSTIFRLCNDLISSSELEKGAIELCMRETGVSKVLAQKHIHDLIDQTWKKMNKERIDHETFFSEAFTETCINLARQAHCTYQNGDGHSAPDAAAKKRVLSVKLMALKLSNLPYDMFSLRHSEAPRFQYPRTASYHVTRSHYNHQLTCSTVMPQIPQAAADIEKRSPTCSYQPTTWSFNFLQSLKNDNADEMYKDRAQKLEKEVRGALNNGDTGLLNILEMIDDIQRLGLRYRFEDDIKRNLDKGYLLACVQEDTKGIQSLYEASFLCLEGEDILDKAFMTSSQNNLVANKNSYSRKNTISDQALQLPLHRKIHILEAREHIEAYSRRDDANPLILELAKLNFNMVQSVLKRDLQEMSSWWNDLGLANKLSFARDRLMECFFWTVGMAFEPQFSSCRKGLTKVTSFITVIDDIYDVYGTLEELEMFTEAVERWDVSALTKLPDYMKVCFLALYNTVNEMAYDNLKEQGANVIPGITKAWADLCKTFQQEARWNHNNITPSFEDYFENAWRSAEISSGKSANAITCYMKETGLPEKDACEHIKGLIDQAWKKMNQSQLSNSTSCPRPFMEAAINLARISHFTYQHGDAHGAPDRRSKSRVLSLIIEPIPL
ncbi:hypothetical protein Tsubulata_035874 [Turnera subulata]|uniref:Uncharacterized protein n=1 Tax=Turnera subulata TaxID=218843 RepID=A0A9Q0GKL3_9ROSI|nr:hypothetical protein Tsubulata_035874 [Turnera subulata]